MLKNAVSGFMMESNEGDAEVTELVERLEDMILEDEDDDTRMLVSDELREGIARIGQAHPEIRSDEVLEEILMSLNWACEDAEIAPFTLEELRRLASEG